VIYIFYIVTVMILLVSLGKKWDIKDQIVYSWSICMAILGCLSLYYMEVLFPGAYAVWKIIIGIVGACVLSGGVLLFIFYRDPEREPPSQKRIVVSPADGKVIYVKTINNGELPFAIKGRKEISLKEFIGEEFDINSGFQIGIEMTYVNVHVNRSPITGLIEKITRIPGGFFSLRKVSSLLENERVFTLFSGDEIKLGIVQIASRLVRRIVPFIKNGDQVQIGQRIGKIVFGSQVDVLIPYGENVEITVNKNDEVKAGVSIIANY